MIIMIELKDAWMTKDRGIERVRGKRVVINPKSVDETFLIVALQLPDHMRLV